MNQTKINKTGPNSVEIIPGDDEAGNAMKNMTEEDIAKILEAMLMAMKEKDADKCTLLDFSAYSAGELSNTEDEVACAILDQITEALLTRGSVQVHDPANALWSRVKYPTWNITYRVRVWLFGHLKADWNDRAQREPILNWMDSAAIVPEVLHLENGNFEFRQLTREKIMTRWEATNGS